MSSTLKVFVIAGEPSGDRLGRSLIKGLRANADIDLAGVGGPLMEAVGLRSLFPMSDLAIMGLSEVIPKIPTVLRRISQTVAAIEHFVPDVIITIDSPDFCLRVLKRVRVKLPSAKAVHYVAPSVWAWRPERAEKMARYVDHVLALLPFEPPYMESAGMSCDFVGHPIADMARPAQNEIVTFRSKIPEEKLLAVMPGSRRGEIKRMLPVFGEVVQLLHKAHPSLAIVIPTVKSSEADVQKLTASWPVPVTFISQNEGESWETSKQTAIAASDAALLTSGTVSLEVAHTGCPQVVAWKTNRATTRVLKRVLQVDTGTLVNLVTDTRDIPEFMLENAEAAQIFPTLSALLSSKEKAAQQRATARRAIELLTPPSRHAAAKSVLKFVAGTGAAER